MSGVGAVFGLALRLFVAVAPAALVPCVLAAPQTRSLPDPASLLCASSNPAVLSRQEAGSNQDASDAEEQVLLQLRVAKEGSPAIRPQAARRLLSFGELAAKVVLEKSEHSVPGLSALGKDVSEIVAELPGEALRALCWTALSDPDFPWRPSLSRSLARSATAEESPKFLALLADPISYVRGAGLLALRTLDARAAAPAVLDRLADPDDLVRRDAACLADDWGHPEALAWLVEELARHDQFFDRALGKTARYAAARELSRRLGDLEGYDPAADPASPEQQAVVAGLRARLAEKLGAPLPTLPEIARADAPALVDRVGLEIRSCRRGEYFVRWCEGDVLAVGLGNPRCFALPAGTVAELVAATQETLAELGGARFFGAPGCDAELLHLRGDPASRAEVVSVSKGPDPVQDLRPAPLGQLASRLLQSLPAAFDQELPALRGDLRRALEAVGGALPEAKGS